MTGTGTAWIKTPEITATVTHGTGKSVVNGPVRIAFTEAGQVYISTDGAHHNDDRPALRYRDTDWIASAHLTRAADGTWSEYRAVSYGVSRRGQIGSGDHTPPTYRAAIIAALCAAAAEHWTPELDRAAAYSRAAQRLHQDEKERDGAAAALAEIDARIAANRAIMAASAPLDPAPFVCGTCGWEASTPGEEAANLAHAAARPACPGSPQENTE